MELADAPGQLTDTSSMTKLTHSQARQSECSHPRICISYSGDGIEIESDPYRCDITIRDRPNVVHFVAFFDQGSVQCREGCTESARKDCQGSGK